MKVLGQPDGLALSDLLGHDSRSPKRRIDEPRATIDGRCRFDLMAEGWTRGDLLAEYARARADDDAAWAERLAKIGAVPP